MGQEHVGKGVNIALGPMMNLGRVAEGGRNWEGFGADPYLAAESAYETILGLQNAGVQACAKHLVNKYVAIHSMRLFLLFTQAVSKNISAPRVLQMWMTGLNTRFIRSRF